MNHSEPRFQKSFYFVRHGQTVWNKDGIYQGQNDIPLNETGRLQARACAEKIMNLEVDAVFTSPLQRARHTAETILAALRNRENDPELVEIPELMECQSVSAATFVLRKKGITDLPSFEKMPKSPETPESFIARVAEGLRRILAGPHANPLIVAHGGTSTAICEALAVPVIRTPNCCLVRFEIQQDGHYKTIMP